MDRSTFKREINQAIVKAKELVKASQEKIHIAKQKGGLDRETLKEFITIQKQWLSIAQEYADFQRVYIRTFSVVVEKDFFIQPGITKCLTVRATKERIELMNWCKEMVIAVKLDEAVIQIKQLEIQLKGRLT